MIAEPQVQGKGAIFFACLEHGPYPFMYLHKGAIILSRENMLP